MTFALLHSQKNLTLLQRLVALLCDGLLLSIPTHYAFFLIISQPSLAAMTTHSILMIAFVFVPSVVLYSFYRVLCTMKWGKTLGKALMGLEVVTEDGKALSFKRTFFREIIGNSLNAFSFRASQLWSLYDEKSQTWYDLLAGTLVVRKHKRVSLAVCLLVLIMALYVFCYAIFFTTIQKSPVFNELGAFIMSLYR